MRIMISVLILGLVAAVVGLVTMLDNVEVLTPVNRGVDSGTVFDVSQPEICIQQPGLAVHSISFDREGPFSSHLVVGCEEVGVLPIFVEVKDGLVVETFVIIQDNTEMCGEEGP